MDRAGGGRGPVIVLCHLCQLPEHFSPRQEKGKAICCRTRLLTASRVVLSLARSNCKVEAPARSSICSIKSRRSLLFSPPHERRQLNFAYQTQFFLLLWLAFAISEDLTLIDRPSLIPVTEVASEIT
jgi:hypothetical protein